MHLMTFDNEEELYKIKSVNPSARLVLRILADDPSASVNVRICRKAIHFCFKLLILCTAWRQIWS